MWDYLKKTENPDAKELKSQLKGLNNKKPSYLETGISDQKKLELRGFMQDGAETNQFKKLDKLEFEPTIDVLMIMKNGFPC